MKHPKRWLQMSLIGSVVIALCCFTPILVITLGALGLAALTGYLDFVLLPALAVFIGVTAYAYHRVRQQHQAVNEHDGLIQQPGERHE